MVHAGKPWRRTPVSLSRTSVRSEALSRHSASRPTSEDCVLGIAAGNTSAPPWTGGGCAAWWCADEARMLGCSLPDVALMAEVSAYNEVDCQVMMEAVEYLRGRAGAGVREEVAGLG